MEKKENRYHLHLDQLSVKTDTFEPASLESDFSNHDDLLHIVQLMQTKPLFSEVMLKHRSDPLFAELAQAFGPFMKKLKAS